MSQEPIKKFPVSISLGSISLQGDMAVPSNSHALIIFAHRCGSSRFSERNRMVASYLNNGKGLRAGGKLVQVSYGAA